MRCKFSSGFVAGIFLSLACGVSAHAQQDPMQSPGMPQQQSPSSTTQQQQQPTTHPLPTQGMDSSAPGATANAMRDKVFLRQASEGGMTEIEFSRLALEKTTAEDVKRFANRMVNDHTALMEKLHPFSEQYGVTAQKELNKEHKAELAKLNTLSGDDFDKEYLTVMVDAHHKDLKEFQLEQTATDNNDFRTALGDAVKVIARHTAWVDMLAKKRSISTPTVQ